MSHIPVTYKQEEADLVAAFKKQQYPEMTNTTILKAAKGLPVETLPTWLHRQAGRYLPTFQAVRKQHGFFDVCRTPTLAAQVTLEPIDTFPELDASIIFSDILVIPQAIGVEVEMQDKVGPVIPQPLRTPADLDRVIFNPDIDASLQYVYDAICLTRHGLTGRVPLIGFCGAPWTLFAYMCEGRSSKTYEESKKFLYHYPAEAHKLMQLITDSCVTFLVGQAKAGAQMLQVFESSGGELGFEVFNEFALPYLLQIPARVKTALRELGIKSLITTHTTYNGTEVQCDDIPISCFPRMCTQSLPYLALGQYDVFSLDHTAQPVVARQMVSPTFLRIIDTKIVKDMVQWFKPGVVLDSQTQQITVDETVALSVTLQGNIDPYLLYADHSVIQEKAESCLRGFGMDRYIVNLGHGMLPTHSPDAVRTLTTTVKRVAKAMQNEKQQ